MDPSHSNDKKNKQTIDEGIPKVCPCGGPIVVETSLDEQLGRRYFTCNVFENDGLHRRKSWDDGVEQELFLLRKEVEEQKRIIRLMDLQIEEMRLEWAAIAGEFENLK